MNPKEIFEFFAKLLRETPEIFAAFVLGIVGGAALLWKLKPAGDPEKLADEMKKRIEAEGKLEASEKKVSRLEGLLTSSSRQVSELQGEKNALTLKATALQVDNDKLNTSAVQLRTANEKLVAYNKLLAEKRGQVEAQLQLLCQEKADLEAKIQPLQRKIAQLTAHLEQKSLDLVAKARKLEDLLKGADDLERKLADACCENAQLKVDSDHLKADWDKLRTRYNRKCKQHRTLRRHLDKVVTQAGRSWERPVLDATVPFIALATRKCPIIALVNLKGGVGKTTLTLNIAATLAGQGKRVLLVDLDHQRSLSQLCVLAEKRKQLHKHQRGLQHFLLLRDELRKPEYFASCITPVNGIDRCSIVVNTDPSERNADGDRQGLADAEESLLFEWLTRVDVGQDVRLYLRSALHDSVVADSYDYIFLDCPPRFTTATINGLAACDFVLIPVGVDAISTTNPLPQLLRELKRLRAPDRFPHLAVMGVVANRVQAQGGSGLSSLEMVLDQIPVTATKEWGKPIHCFENQIKHSIAFSRAAHVLIEDSDSTAVVHYDAAVRNVFRNIVTEMEERIKNESQQPAGVHS